MSRYQCPLCSGIHRSEDLARCPLHTYGYDPACENCRDAVALIPCGGGQ
ncbi:hypothetical protein [Streptosporangium sp. NPDC049644]